MASMLRVRILKDDWWRGWMDGMDYMVNAAVC